MPGIQCLKLILLVRKLNQNQIIHWTNLNFAEACNEFTAPSPRHCT